MDSSNHNQKLQPQAPDAFAVLLSGSQSQSAAKRRKSGDQQAAGKYINCPVCQTSIPKSFIETHTEDCLLRANSSSQKHQQQRTDQCPNPSGHAAATSAGAAASPSSNKQQLLLGSPTKPASGAAAARSPSKSPRATQLYRSPRQRLPPDEFKAVVSAGWDRALKYVPGACEGGGGPPPLPAQLQILAQQQQSVTQQMQQQPQQQQPSAMSAGAQAAGSCAGNSSGPPAPAEPPAPAVAAGAAAGAGAVSTPGAAPAAMDAFAVLRSAQAAQVPMEAQLYLEGRQDGSWVCHWRLAGSPLPSNLPEEPAWSATVNANLPRQQAAAAASGSSARSGGGGRHSSSIPTGSTKLRLEVATNIVPGFGTAVDWDNPLLASNGLLLCGDSGWCGLAAAGQHQQQQERQQQQQQQDEMMGGEQQQQWREGGEGQGCDMDAAEQQQGEGDGMEGEGLEEGACMDEGAEEGESEGDGGYDSAWEEEWQGHGEQQWGAAGELPEGDGWDEEQEGEECAGMDVNQDDDAAAAGFDAAPGHGGSGAGGYSKPPPRWRGGGPGVLISALQKSIRRGLAASATRIALELLKDPKTAETFTRRLAIICLEDGLLHPQLPLVVWTMLALGKGYVMGGSLANALLSITHQMASVPYRDHHVSSHDLAAAPGAVTAPPATWHAVDAALGSSSSQESLLVKSVLIRAAWGGMTCDRDMLLACAGLWTARFSGRTLPPPPIGCAVLQQQPQGCKQQAPQQLEKGVEQQEQLEKGVQQQAHAEHQAQENPTGATAATAQQQQQQQKQLVVEEDEAAQATGQQPSDMPAAGCPDPTLVTVGEAAVPQDAAAVQALAASAAAAAETPVGTAAQTDGDPHNTAAAATEAAAGGGGDGAADVGGTSNHKVPAAHAPHGPTAAKSAAHDDASKVQVAAVVPAGGTSNPTPSSSSSTTTSVWLRFLQMQYAALDPPADATRVTAVAALSSDDIPLAAVDFHVASGLTQHLMSQPQVKAAVRHLAANNTAVAARLSAPDGLEGLLNSTLWLFRSSLNRKLWLQFRYLQAAAAAAAAGCGGAGAGGGASSRESSAAGSGLVFEFPCSRRQLEAAAAAALAGTWQHPQQQEPPAAAPPAHLVGCSSSGGGGGGSVSGLQSADAATQPAASAAQHAMTAGQQPQVLPARASVSESALRALELELNSLAAHEQQVRQQRQLLLPLWRELAVIADAWSRDYISRRLY